MITRFFTALCQFIGVLVILSMLGSNLFLLYTLNGRLIDIKNQQILTNEYLDSINTHRSI